MLGGDDTIDSRYPIDDCIKSSYDIEQLTDGHFEMPTMLSVNQDNGECGFVKCSTLQWVKRKIEKCKLVTVQKTQTKKKQI